MFLSYLEISECWQETWCFQIFQSMSTGVLEQKKKEQRWDGVWKQWLCSSYPTLQSAVRLHSLTGNCTSTGPELVVITSFDCTFLFQNNDFSLCFCYEARYWKFTLWTPMCTPKTWKQCLFCLMRQKHFWSYFALSWTRFWNSFISNIVVMLCNIFLSIGNVKFSGFIYVQPHIEYHEHCVSSATFQSLKLRIHELEFNLNQWFLTFFLPHLPLVIVVCFKPPGFK